MPASNPWHQRCQDRRALSTRCYAGQVMALVAETEKLTQKFKYFRTTDVTDALDALGRADLTLMDERIKPLWQGIRFWGPAVTVRALPANIRMPVLSPEEAIRSHAIWFAEHGGMQVGEA